MKRIVIYTAVFGAYDRVRRPLYADRLLEHADLVCFTDAEPPEEPWEHRCIPLPVPGDPVRSNRKLKILSHQVFPSYEYSLYIDANITLVCSNIWALIDNWLSRANMACFHHSYNQCVYQEARWVVGSGVGSRSLVESQMARYRAEEFPQDFGKINGNILLRRHAAEDIKQLCECWWQEFAAGGPRDQLAFDYCRWKTHTHVAYFPGMWCNNIVGFREGHQVRQDRSLRDSHPESMRPRDKIRKILRRTSKRMLKGFSLKRTRAVPQPERPATERLEAIGHRVATPGDSCSSKRSQALATLVAGLQLNMTNEPPSIINVGAGIGVVEAAFGIRLPRASFVAFEPDRNRFQLLEENCRFLQHSSAHISLVNGAVSDCDGDVPFYQSASVWRHALAGDSITGIVPARDILGLLQHCVTLLRVNTPGLELRIVQRLGRSGALSRVATVLIHYHCFADQPSELAQVLDVLQTHGFRCHVQASEFPFPSGEREIHERVEAVTAIYGWQQR